MASNISSDVYALKEQIERLDTEHRHSRSAGHSVRTILRPSGFVTDYSDFEPAESWDYFGGHRTPNIMT